MSFETTQREVSAETQTHRVGLVHALRDSMAPIAAALERHPGIAPIHLYDESLYIDYMRAGGLTPGLHDRVTRLLHHSADCGAEAILFTGSLFSPAVEAAREHMAIPVLTAYEAVIERALDRRAQRGSEILVMATLEKTLDVLVGDLVRQAERRAVVGSDGSGTANDDRAYRPRRVAIEDGFVALRQGDRERHDGLIVEAVKRMANDARYGWYDPIVLAQFSMTSVRARLPSALQERVLTSAECAADALARLFADG